MLIAAHLAAQAIVDRMTEMDAPDGQAFDDAVQAEIDAMDAIVKAPCTNDDAIFANAAYIIEFADGDEHEEMAAVALLKNYLKQRQALASPREQYDA